MTSPRAAARGAPLASGAAARANVPFFYSS
jgi:hypothetical protein